MLRILLPCQKNQTGVMFTEILILVILVTLTGCAGRYGSLRKNGEVNRVFKTYQILPGYNYYYSGPKGRPDAIMGIHRNYTLQTTQWTRIDLTGD